MSEREQADRWWAAHDDRSAVYLRHAFNSDVTPPAWIHQWWDGLPDARAVAIYKQESGQ